MLAAMRTLMMAVVVPLLMVALAACGSSGSGDGVASAGGTRSSSPAPRTGDDSGLKFARCMREHGVDIPDPEPGKLPPVVDGPPDSKEHEALESCEQFLPSGGEVEKISAEDLEKVRQYARCMREHGVDMPDPSPDGSLTGGAIAGGDAAQLDAADRACQSKLPGQDG
jgi:hypothetical protein